MLNLNKLIYQLSANLLYKDNRRKCLSPPYIYLYIRLFISILRWYPHIKVIHEKFFLHSILIPHILHFLKKTIFSYSYILLCRIEICLLQCLRIFFLKFFDNNSLKSCIISGAFDTIQEIMI